MNIYTIYKIQNLVNGKPYIGYTKDYDERMKKHKHNSMSLDYPLYKAIRKYGWNNFECSILYQSTDGQHTLEVMEKHFIMEYESFGKFGYNMTMGGQGGAPNLNAIENISEKAKQRWSDINSKYNQPDFKVCISKSVTNLHQNTDTYKSVWKQKKSNAMKSFWCSEVSKSSRKFISHQTKTRWLDEEYKNRVQESMRGKYRTQYIFINPDGVLINQFGDFRGFCKNNGLNDSCMRLVMKGERKSHKGWSVTRTVNP